MSIFQKSAIGGIRYTWVLDIHKPSYPFGVCGPLKDVEEAEEALEILQQAYPENLYVVCMGHFTGSEVADFLEHKRTSALAVLRQLTPDLIA